ncbi:MAG TPA: hypothetical protein VG125_15435 [Pirellulales bacterium]|nr:hypothetical protein [Pirellulales bacterium]
MSQPELLKAVIEVLTGADIPYMVTGSLASSLQGEPRSTHDIDLIVALALDQAEVLSHAFPPPDYYLSYESVREAIRQRTMFNLLDIRGGDRVDFWLLTNDEFDRMRFSRRRLQRAEPVGISINVSSPEDTILAKLRWAQLSGGSEKHFHDALRVYEVQHLALDHKYLNEWAQRLGVESLWQRLQAEAENTAHPRPGEPAGRQNHDASFRIGAQRTRHFRSVTS